MTCSNFGDLRQRPAQSAEPVIAPKRRIFCERRFGGNPRSREDVTRA